MATALALLEQYSTFRETVEKATERVKATAVTVKGQVVESTKGGWGRARDLLGQIRLLNSEEEGALDPEAQSLQSQSQLQQPLQPQAQGQAGTSSQEESSQILDELNQACNLTFKQRVYGFATCLSLGVLCCILSLFVLFHPVKFGLAYSIGNLMSIGSTGFLIGFQRQLTMMFDPIRRVAAVVYVIALFATLFSALLVRDPLLTLVCILVQGSALLWYSMSYIPYAQAAAKRIVRLFIQSEF